MVQKKITVSIPKFDEARPVAEIVQTASRFNSTMYFISGSKKINAKSIVGMMSLGLDTGEDVTVSADGADESAAVDGIEEFLSGKAV